LLKLLSPRGLAGLPKAGGGAAGPFALKLLEFPILKPPFEAMRLAVCCVMGTDSSLQHCSF